MVTELDKSFFTIANIMKVKRLINSISQAMCEYGFQPCHIGSLLTEWRDYSAHISRWGSSTPVINIENKAHGIQLSQTKP